MLQNQQPENVGRSYRSGKPLHMPVRNRSYRSQTTTAHKENKINFGDYHKNLPMQTALARLHFGIKYLTRPDNFSTSFPTKSGLARKTAIEKNVLSMGTLAMYVYNCKRIGGGGGNNPSPLRLTVDFCTSRIIPQFPAYTRLIKTISCMFIIQHEQE